MPCLTNPSRRSAFTGGLKLSPTASVWAIVVQWDWFAKRTVGAQWVDAADSMGADIAEAGGRYHPADVRSFLYHARGSLRETKYWMRRAVSRSLLAAAEAQGIDEELETLSAEINNSIRYQNARIGRDAPSPTYVVREGSQDGSEWPVVDDVPGSGLGGAPDDLDALR